MGCIIKYKGQSISEEQFLQYLNKQIAINNLFNENESLANAVYEALGFDKQINEIADTKKVDEFIKKYKDALPNIKDGKTLISHLQTVSNRNTGTTKQFADLIIKLSKSNKGLEKLLNNPNLYAKPNSVGDEGAFHWSLFSNLSVNKIVLELDHFKNNTYDDVFLHELIHNLTTQFIVKDSDLFNQSFYNKVKELYSVFDNHLEANKKVNESLLEYTKNDIKNFKKLKEYFEILPSDAIQHELLFGKIGSISTVKDVKLDYKSLENKSKQDVIKELERLSSFKESRIQEIEKGDKDYYYFNSKTFKQENVLSEFLATFMNDANFREQLKNIDYKNNKSIFQSIIDLISEFIGLTKNDSLYNEFVLNLTNFINNNDYSTIAEQTQKTAYQNRINLLEQQKQQALQLYSQYLEQNPNGSVEQFKNWIKGDKREYKSSSASLPLRGGKKVEYKNVSEFSEAINFLSQRFEINVILNKLNDDTQLSVFGSTGPLGNYDAVNNTVNINRDEEIYEGVIVHEFIHGFSRLMQTYNKKAFRSLVDYHYNSLSTDTETIRSLWKIAYDYGNLETIPKTLSELPEGQSKDYIYDEIFTRLIEREYNENGSLKDFEKPSSIFYKLFEWVKNFFGIKYNREKEFSKLTTSSTVKDFYNILKKVDNLKVSKEEYIKGTNTNESIYNVYKILNNRKFEDLNSQEKEEVNRYMKEYNDYMKSLPKLSISQKSQERLNQIQEIFNQNPELSKIGTVEQYASYLDTIFPNSKVEEIDRHAASYPQMLEDIKKEGINNYDESFGENTFITEEEINVIIKNEVTYVDENDKPCAEKGIKPSIFTKRGEWKIIKELKGRTHEEGGIDITIGKDGVKFKNNDSDIKAEFGLVIPEIKAQNGLVVSKYKPTKTEEDNITYYSIPSSKDFVIDYKNVDNLLSNAKSRKPVLLNDKKEYLSDYGKDNTGEYISFYRKDGAGITGIFTPDKEYYDRKYINRVKLEDDRLNNKIEEISRVAPKIASKMIDTPPNYNYSNSLLLTQGRYNTGKLPKEMLAEMYNIAKLENIDVYDLLSVAGRESTFGINRGLDRHAVVSGWNLNNKYIPKSLAAFIADKKVPFVKATKDNYGYQYEITDYSKYKEFIKNNPKILTDYEYYINGVPKPNYGNYNSYREVARMIKNNQMGRYNPGDPDYQNKLRREKELLLKEKAITEYLKILSQSKK